MVAATLSLKVGEGNEPGVFMGPIQKNMQYERVKGMFEHVKEEKLEIAVGGDIPSGKGYFVNPTIVDRPPETSRLVVEEPFGVSTILPCIPTVPYHLRRAHRPPPQLQHLRRSHRKSKQHTLRPGRLYMVRKHPTRQRASAENPGWDGLGQYAL